MFRHYCAIIQGARSQYLAKVHKYVNAVVGDTTQTQTQYIPGQHNDSINIQTVYTATIQDFIRTVTTE